MIQGRIIKGIGGFYYVQLSDGTVVECKARGRFRKEGKPPLVGDQVAILRQKEGNALIDAILPRKNTLVRPQASNIDRLIIVASASAPQPDWMLIDKLLLQARQLSIEPLLVLNKCDIADPHIQASFETDYRCYNCLYVSAATGEGIDILKALLKKGVSCFAGQSAVGKSSLLNALMPGLQLETGGLSKKTDRGRHTTRHAQLIPFDEGAVLDTPGFSLYDVDDMTQEMLDSSYPEFADLPLECRFAGCRHVTEPDCAVREMVNAGGMSTARYERYVHLVKDFEERRKHRYD